jgi:hypothetical protein
MEKGAVTVRRVQAYAGVEAHGLGASTMMMLIFLLLLLGLGRATSHALVGGPGNDGRGISSILINNGAQKVALISCSEVEINRCRKSDQRTQEARHACQGHSRQCSGLCIACTSSEQVQVGFETLCGIA